MARYFRRMHHGTAYQHFTRSRVSLGGLKYMLGAVVTTMLAEKIKTPEQRYLLLAGIGLMVGLAETSWRDHINAEWDAFRAARGK